MLSQILSVKHAKQLAAEAKPNASARHPAEALPGSAAHPPAQAHPLRCSPFGGVLGTHFLNSIGANVLKVFARAGRQVTQVKAAQELRIRSAIAIRSIDARRVTPVEDLVHFDRCRIKPAARLALHLQAHGAGNGDYHWVIIQYRLVPTTIADPNEAA
jgi:hypothetical protein